MVFLESKHFTIGKELITPHRKNPSDFARPSAHPPAMQAVRAMARQAGLLPQGVRTFAGKTISGGGKAAHGNPVVDLAGVCIVLPVRASCMRGRPGFGEAGTAWGRCHGMRCYAAPLRGAARRLPACERRRDALHTSVVFTVTPSQSALAEVHRPLQKRSL